MFEAAVFYAFGAVLLASGVAVITARNPVHGVLFLVLAFFTAAALWLLLNAEFLAIVLFLFVVMMLDINLERVREGFWRNLPLALVVGGVMVWEMITILAFRYFGVAPRQVPPDYSNTRELGRVLYTDYALAFEVAAVILLVAIVAAIALTLRRRKDSRRQDPSQQVKARRAERVRLVSMPAEKER